MGNPGQGRILLVLSVGYAAAAQAGPTIPEHDWTYTVGTAVADLNGIGDGATDFDVRPDGSLCVVGNFGHQFSSAPLSADFDPSADTDLQTSLDIMTFF